MPFCAAFGCNSRHKKDSGVSLFRFPKDAGRRKAWTIYCRREDFSPTDNNRLCSLHFSKEQLDRDPEKLKENGYADPRIRLRKDAFPDIPLSLGKPQDENATISFPPRKPRGAYVKRQRADVIQQVLTEMEPRSNEEEPTSATQSEDEPHLHGAQAAPESDEPPRATVLTEVSIPHQPPVGKPKGIQTSLRPPQRTRRIQVSMSTDSTVQTVSTAVQCSSLSDGIPLRVAAGLVVPEAVPHHLAADSDTEDEDPPTHEPDPDFDPLAEDSDSDEEPEEDSVGAYPLRISALPEEERHFLVSETSLAKLLQHCDICGELCQTSVQFTRGTMIGTVSVCSNGHSSQWESQKSHQGMPWSNLLLAGSIVFSGLNISKCLRFLQHLKVPAFSASTFNRIQSAYVVPSILFTWDFHQAELLDMYQDRMLTLGGDARCDSPGFCAKYGSYTLMDLENGKVLDFQLVQSNEVAGSTHMELEGLKRGLRRVEEAGIEVEALVTDRHGMVKKYMRTEHPDKKHYFDVWHLAKGISKKLDLAAKKRDCEDIRLWVKSSVNHCYWVAASSGDDENMKEEKWSSLVEHVTNRHENCHHGVLNEERQWLREGSRAHKLFRDVVESKFLMKDIGKLSPLHQTYGLEVFHSVVNTFAPKSTHFFYPAMLARLSVAALHFNENGHRNQAVTKAGELQWHISYPKGKKGEHAVVKPNKTPITYGYVDILRLNLVERRLQLPSYPAATADGKATLGYQPPPLTSGYIAVNKQDLITTHRTRFA
uniref:Uncharacterized protein LOC111114388 n=1 Tax=Crassostrea virginica TaxID=6565 RepID=A0A8B8BZW4_CRAVI